MALFFQIPNREPSPCSNLRPPASVSPNRLRSVKCASLKIGFVFPNPLHPLARHTKPTLGSFFQAASPRPSWLRCAKPLPAITPRHLASFLKPSFAPLIWLRSVNRPSPTPKPAIGFVFESLRAAPKLASKRKKTPLRVPLPAHSGFLFHPLSPTPAHVAAENQSAAA